MVILSQSNPTYKDVIRHINEQAEIGSRDPRLISIAENLKRSSKNLEKAVFDWAYSYITYVPDGELNGEMLQDIRTINNILTTGQGNCVTYSTIISALFRILGIPHKFKMVAYEAPKEYEHIYVITKNNVLDCVIGQPQDGTAKNGRPLQGRFNEEVKNIRDYKIEPVKLRVINGIKSPVGSTHRRITRSKARRLGLPTARPLKGWFSDTVAKFDPSPVINQVADKISETGANVDPFGKGMVGSSLAQVDPAIAANKIGDSFNQFGSWYDTNVLTPNVELSKGLNQGLTGLVSDPETLGALAVGVGGAVAGNPQLVGAGASLLSQGLTKDQAGNNLPRFNNMQTAGFGDFFNDPIKIAMAAGGVLLLGAIFTAKDVKPKKR